MARKTLRFPVCDDYLERDAQRENNLSGSKQVVKENLRRKKSLSVELLSERSLSQVFLCESKLLYVYLGKKFGNVPKG